MASTTTSEQLEWHEIDASNQVLGRVATRAAALLMGKHRTDFARNVVAPVRVVITNSDTVVLTGRKEQQKMYRHYTGHPGGLRERTAAVQRQRDSRKMIEAAVAGMLPKNNMRDSLLGNLRVYPGSEHPHKAQLSST